MPAPWPSTGSSPKASTATRQNSSRPAPERSSKCSSGCSGTGRRSWRTGPRRGRRPRPRRRSPAAPRRSAIRFSTAGSRESATARPVTALAALSSSPQPGEERQRQGDAGERGSAAPSRPWSTAAWPAKLSASARRACTASTAGSAPRAPIASVPSSQSRSWERTIRQPQATSSAEQAAARVGEVERQQQRRQRADRDPAQRRGQRAPAHPQAAAPRRSRKRRPLAFQ